MAHSNTTTTTVSNTTTTKKSQLKLTVPTPLPTKMTKPWEGLLMPDPGSDYDQHEARLDLVDYMLNIAAEDGAYRYMVNWRHNPFFYDDEETKVPVKRTDSAVDMHETTKRPDSSVELENEKVATKGKPNWLDCSGGWPETDKAKRARECEDFGLRDGEPWAMFALSR